MQQVGIPQLQAHFFAFYFAVFSTLTPPVAVSVLAAAKLSGARLNVTAIDSMKIACTTFIIPFAFVFRPELMSFPEISMATLKTVVLVIIMQIAVAAANYAYLFKSLVLVERIFLWGAFAALFTYLVNGGELLLWLGSGILSLQAVFGLFKRTRESTSGSA